MRLAVLFLLLSCLMPALTEETPPIPSGETNTTAQLEEIVVPVRIHLVQSESNADLATTLTDEDINRIMGKVNMIWAQARIRLPIESIVKTTALDIKPPDKEKGYSWVMALMPKTNLLEKGINVYYVKNLQPNGFYSRGFIYVKDTARLQPVEGGLDEPIPRVTSHEIGHALGLPHRQDVTNLMASGKSGYSLNQAEIEITRAKAKEKIGTVPKE